MGRSLPKIPAICLQIRVSEVNSELGQAKESSYGDVSRNKLSVQLSYLFLRIISTTEDSHKLKVTIYNLKISY
jgi:hypothetical protein